MKLVAQQRPCQDAAAQPFSTVAMEKEDMR